MPLVQENSVAFGPKAHDFLHELGLSMEWVSLEPKPFQFLIQTTSMAEQRDNAAAVLLDSNNLKTISV